MTTKSEPESLPEMAESTPSTSPEGEPYAEYPGANARLWLWVTLFTISSVLTIVLNSVLIRGLLKSNLTEHPSDIYLLSLVAARILIGMFVIPTRITSLFADTYLGSVYCKLCHYISDWSSTTSILCTTIIAMLKLKHTLNITREVIQTPIAYYIIGAASAWVVGSIYAIRSAILYDVSSDEGGCSISEDKHFISIYMLYMDLALLFIIPGLVIGLCVTRVVTLLRNINIECPEYSYQRNAISMVTTIASLFFICNAFLYGYKIYEYNTSKDNKLVEMILYYISYSNAWMNAIVLLYFRTDLHTLIANGLRRTSLNNQIIPLTQTNGPQIVQT